MYREITLEFRDSLSFLASLLYLVAITYVVYRVFGDLDSPAKVGLILILLLFSTVNIVGQSFSYNTSNRKLNHYMLYDPVELITAKLVLNFVKVLIATAILLGLVVVFSNAPLKDPILYGKTLFLTALGLTAILTLISSITSMSTNQSTLVHLLSIPLMIPILLLSMRLSLISERFIVDTASDNYFLMLIGIDVIFIVVLFVFIPITWKS